MQRLLSVAVACLISCVLAFAQGTAADQSSATSQQSSGATAASPKNNVTGPTRVRRAPSNGSSPNQAQSGNDAGANGQEAQPNGAQSNGTAAAPGDNTGNNAGSTDAAGNDPASGRGSNTYVNPGTGGTLQWFWIALGIIVGAVLIGVLVSRNHAKTNIEPADPALRVTDERNDVNRRDDQIRRAG